MDVLWPDLEPEAAANNLHKALYVARRALSPDASTAGSHISLQGEMVALNPPAELWTDVEAFQEAVIAARKTSALTAYEEAAHLYTGDLLPEDLYEDWAAGRREELGKTYLDFLFEMAGLYETQGSHPSAIDVFRKIVAREPLHEAAHVGLMRIYALNGQRHQALRQYQHLSEALRRELDIEPDASSQRLFEDILSGSFPIQGESQEESPSVTAIRSNDSSIATTLVARDAELEALEEALDLLFSGRGSLVLIGGEAGIGKSRLASEIAARVVRRGGLVIRGSGYEQEGQLAYGPFVDALEGFAQQLPSAELEEMLAGASLEAARLMPNAAAATGIDVAATQRSALDRHRLFSGVAAFLRRVAARAPALLVLDNLHASDEGSLQILHYLARTSSDTPLLVLGTFRTEEAGPDSPLGRFITDAMRERLAVRLDLQRLPARDSDVLVSSLLGGDPVDRRVFELVFELTAGNPLYTEEVVRSLRESGQLEQADGRWRCHVDTRLVPQSLAQLVLARLERLRATERQVLNTIAVTGHETQYQILRAAVQISEGELLDALDKCLAWKLIEESSEGYRFEHPLYREVIYEHLAQARRASLHGMVAEAIETVYARSIDVQAEALAYHRGLSNEPGSAVPYLITAGDHAADVYANEVAIAHYQKALELLEAPGGPGSTPMLAAELREKIGDHYALAGQGSRATESYQAAVSALQEASQGPRLTLFGFRRRSGGREEAVDERVLVRLHRKTAYAFLIEHDPNSAEPHLISAEELLVKHADDAERGQLLHVRAQWLWERGQHAEALKYAEESLELAEKHGGPSDVAAVYETLALVFHSLGEWKRGLQCELQYLDANADAPQLAHVFDAHH